MKNNIFKNLIAVLLFSLIFSACDDEDYTPTAYDSVRLKLSASTFTVLDSELQTTIDFQSKSKVISKVTLSVAGTELYTADAADNKADFTLKRSDLGLSEVGDEVKLDVKAVEDGVEKDFFAYISMESASSIKVPQTENEDGDMESDPVYELSDVVKNFTYKISPVHASAEKVAAYAKVGEKSDYALLWSKSYDSSDLNIGVKGSDYSKNDTLYIQLIATTGQFTDTVSTSVVIQEYLLGQTTNVKLDVVDNGFDLVEGSIASVDGANCMIEFTHDVANLKQGIMALNSTELFYINGSDKKAELKNEKNLPVLKDAFLAGETITVVEDVKVDDKFIIKHVRDGKEYYGVLKITEVNTSRETDQDYVAFDWSIEEYNTSK